MRLINKYGDKILTIISITIFILVTANAFKYTATIKQIIQNNSDFIGALNKAVTTILLILGSIASYYRFFRGRTFVARAELTLDVSVHDTIQDHKLHLINLELKNIGTIAIHEPSPTITISIYSSTGVNTYKISNWWDPVLEEKTFGYVSLVDSGEYAQFYASEYIPNDILVVTYIAKVEAKNDDTWQRVITVPNHSKSSG